MKISFIPKIFTFAFVVVLLSVSCNTEEEYSHLYDFYKPNPLQLPSQEVATLDIGASAPDFKLPGIDGKFHSLSDYKNSEILVIVFTCNHCPTAQAYEERLIEIANEFKNQSVQLVAISPTSPLGLLYEELGYSDLDDDFDAMKIRSEDMTYNFPYLYDGDDQKVSILYGPSTTPQVFVFDKERKLQYRGRIDAKEKPGSGQGEDLRNALESLLQNKPVTEPTTKAFGCSTKWAWKVDYKEVVDKKWAETSVELELADSSEISTIMKNDSTGKLRLINVWATWCGPCILEYPEFIVLQRMYGQRAFEFISISADKPSEQKNVLKFLQEQQSAVKNILSTQQDKYELIESIDPNWNGALPYSALIEPGGKIVWAHQGPVDFLDLKKTIVNHSLMGRYY